MATPSAIPGRSILFFIQGMARIYRKFGAHLDPVFSTPVKDAIVTLILAIPQLESDLNPPGPG